MSTTFGDLLKEVATEHDRELLALRKEIQLLHQQIQQLQFTDDDDVVPCERTVMETDGNGFTIQPIASDTYVFSSNSKDSKDFTYLVSTMSNKSPEVLDVVDPQKPRLNFEDTSSLKSKIKAQKAQIKQQMLGPKLIVSLDGLDSSLSDGSWNEGQGRRKVSLAPEVKDVAKNARKSNATIDDNSTVIAVEDLAEDMLPDQQRWTIGSSGFSSYDFIEADANAYKHANELRKWFAFLDFSRKRYLTPKDIHALIVRVEGTARKSVEWVERTIESLNVTLSIMPNHCLKTAAGPSSAFSDGRSSFGGTQSHNTAMSDGPADSDLQFPGFVELIVWDNFSQFARDVGAVLYIRDVLIKASVEELVVKASHLQMPTETPKNPFILTVLEPIVAFVVFANALTIGLSQDIHVTWQGWYSMEIGFTSFFIGEILIKVAICGFFEHFWRGDDARWNIFDSMLVLVAVTDLILTETGRENSFGDAMVVRIVRLARFSRLLRLIRLLRLGFFKELLLMIKGVIAGMRTLFWAFVLMLVTMYVVAVGLRQSEMKDERGDIIFKSLGWSMFTVFVCFTGECTLLDGTPLPLLLFGRYDWRFAIPFTIANIGIGFGLFNLVMAIFVENVNESSKQKRQLSNEEERAKVCRNLRDLIMKFGGMSSKMEAAARYATINKRARRKHRASLFVNVSTRLTTLIRGTTYFSKSQRSTGMHSSPTMSSTASHMDMGGSISRAAMDHVHFQFGGQITREVFQERISDLEVQEMLDDLDIHVGDRTEIFDVIDTEMTGFVEVSDLVAGLLKLRSGGADKSDIVQVALGIRSMRKQLNTFMERVLDNQVQLLGQMEDHSRALGDACSTPVVSTDTSTGCAKATPPAALQRNSPATHLSRFSFASPCASARCSHSEALGAFARESWCRPSFISVTSVAPRLSTPQRPSALRQSARTKQPSK